MKLGFWLILLISVLSILGYVGNFYVYSYGRSIWVVIILIALPLSINKMVDSFQSKKEEQQILIKYFREYLSYLGYT